MSNLRTAGHKALAQAVLSQGIKDGDVEFADRRSFGFWVDMAFGGTVPVEEARKCWIDHLPSCTQVW